MLVQKEPIVIVRNDFTLRRRVYTANDHHRGTCRQN